jgi:post-segregation antitoxin (ccd killing protein)
MRMARVSVYLPDDLAREAREAGLNISRLAQEALNGSLSRSETNRWLDGLERLPRADVAHTRVLEAVDRARDEFADRGRH